MSDLFDFMPIENNEDEVKNAFQILIQYSKETGNSRFIYPKNYKGETILPNEITPYLVQFEENGWITWKKDRFSIKEEFKDYHTPQEVAELFYEAVETHFDQGGHFYGVYGISTNYSIRYNFATHELYLEFCELKREVIKEFAIKMGLKHFLEVPIARGTKMNHLEGYPLSAATIKRIAEDVIPMQTYEEIDKYFHTHGFYCGINSNTGQAEIVTVFPSYLSMASLAEAKDQKTVRLILAYCGGSWTKFDNGKYQVVYPKGWSKERYFAELTPDLIDMILFENERIQRRNGVISA